MTQQNIQLFLSQNSKMFSKAQLQQMTFDLQNIDDEKMAIINSDNYKDPTIILIVSIFLGGLGIDRFLIGDIGMGVLKLLTCGGFGIIAIIDWCTIQKRTKKKNYETFQENLSLIGFSGNKNFSDNQTLIQDNSINQIKEYKQLLDNGIITEEEFETKKKELINNV